MTKTDFCIKLFDAEEHDEVKLVTNCGEVICGIVKEVKDDYILFDESCVSGSQRKIEFADIATVGMQFPEAER